MKHLLIYTCLVLAVISCLPPEEVEDTTTINYDLTSKEVKAIYELQDKQEVDSLLLLLQNKYATQRYWAASAFGSIKEKKAVDSLEVLLRDESEAVRIAAAYALGQIGEATSENALIAAFVQEDSTGAYNALNKTILEAVGKLASPSFLTYMSNVQTYQKSDTALLKGQALGIYRYMLRDITNLAATRRMLAIVTDEEYPESIRFIASNYLQRGKNLSLDTLRVDTTLAAAFRDATDKRIRMALAIALGKTKSEHALRNLMEQFNEEQDYRIRCNILRAFGNFDYAKVRDLVFTSLRDKNVHVARSAADFLIKNGISRDANGYRQIARDTTLIPKVRVGLLTAANKHLPNYFVDYKGRTNFALRQIFEQPGDVYNRADALRAMAYYPRMYNYIGQISQTTENPIIQTASMEALGIIARSDQFKPALGLGAKKATQEIGNYLLQGIQSKEPGTIAVASSVLRVPARDFKTVLADSLSILEKALAQLSLPKEIESYNALKKTIDYFQGKESEEPPTVAHNRPIDWALLEGAASATIKSVRGDITIDFLPSSAPASVANFIQLANEGFYDGKNFHRVVPNFVIQGGCPIGSGYGALDYTIRSELPPIYYHEEGYVGMASAGRHTEGTQFFITHSATPHLDGEYTIFAKVRDGMDVVHKIEVGDKIEQVKVN